MWQSEGVEPDYTVSMEPRGAIVTLRGQISVALIRDALEGLSKHPGFSSDMSTVWDARAVVGASDVSFAQLGSISAASAAVRSNARYRAALVVSRTVDFGVGRMAEATRSRPEGLEYQVFLELDAPVAWAFGASDG